MQPMTNLRGKNAKQRAQVRERCQKVASMIGRRARAPTQKQETKGKKGEKAVGKVQQVWKPSQFKDWAIKTKYKLNWATSQEKKKRVQQSTSQEGKKEDYSNPQAKRKKKKRLQQSTSQNRNYNKKNKKPNVGMTLQQKKMVAV